MHNKKFRQLSENLFVSPQVSLTDIKAVVDAGFSTVICHRPDEELSEHLTEDEPKHQTVADLLKKHHVAFIYQPIVHLTMADIEQFSERLAQSTSPVLAYCTSGTRSTLLWGLAQTLIHNQPRHRIAAIAEQAGYNIQGYLTLR